MEPSAYQVPNFWWYSPGFPKHIMNPFYQRNYRNLGCRLISRCRLSILGWKNHIQSCLYPASWLHWIRMTKWTSYWWKTVLPSTKAFGTSGNVSNQNIPFFRRVMLNFSGVARSISMPMKGHPKKKRASWWFLIRVCWDMAAESASAVLQNLVMLKWILLGIPWQLGTYTVWWLRGCTQWRKTKTALYWNFWIS